MDTTFWDDDEDRVQIIYQDDQLPPAHPPLANAAGSGESKMQVLMTQIECRCTYHRLVCAGRTSDLRDRFAEARLTGVHYCAQQRVGSQYEYVFC